MTTSPRRATERARPVRGAATARTARAALATLAAATVALSACTSGAAQTTPSSTRPAVAGVDTNPHPRADLEQGGTLTLPLGQLPASWNVWNADGNLGETAAMLQATDPRLYRVAADGTLTPDTDYLVRMPETRTVGGKETVTYTLNPKARWNDGRAIDWTAFDAMWRANRAPVDTGKFNNVSTTGYEDIERVERGSAPNVVVVTFKKPFYPVTEVFQGLIHPTVGSSPELFNNAFHGTQVHNEWRSGPFVIGTVDTTAGTVTLVPNPRWWGDRPLLDRIVYRRLDDAASLPALAAGELDSVDASTAARYRQVRATSGIDVRRSASLSTSVYVLNAKAPGLTDVAVRKALLQALDRSQWIAVRYAGLDWSEQPLGSLLRFPVQPGYADDVPVRHDVAAARATLAAAGYTQGPDGYATKGGNRVSVRLTAFGDDPTTVAVSQLARRQAEEAGIDLVLDLRPAAAFGDAMQAMDYGVLLMAGASTSPNPIGSVCQLMCSDSPANLAQAGSPALDARIRALGAIADPAAQVRAMNAVERDWMATTYGMMPLASGPEVRAVRSGLANYGPALFAGLSVRWQDVGWVKGSRHR